MPQSMEKERERVVLVRLSVEDWLARPPSVAAVRPCQCVACGAASRPIGGKVVVQGHGYRRRTCLGPASPGGDCEARQLDLRRYRCVHCGAVMVAVPRGLLPRRRYLAAVIGLAIGLWGLRGLATPEVRERVARGSKPGTGKRWRTLERWVVDAAAGAFARVTVTAGHDRRSTAGRVATCLLGFVPPGMRHMDGEAQLYLGGAHAA